jgi:hypothetical protein
MIRGSRCEETRLVGRDQQERIAQNEKTIDEAILASKKELTSEVGRPSFRQPAIHDRPPKFYWQ